VEWCVCDSGEYMYFALVDAMSSSIAVFFEESPFAHSRYMYLHTVTSVASSQNLAQCPEARCTVHVNVSIPHT
jgi:hypothetical protein